MSAPAQYKQRRANTGTGLGISGKIQLSVAYFLQQIVAEGLADPKSFVDDLPTFSEQEIRLVMRDNGLALSQPPA